MVESGQLIRVRQDVIIKPVLQRFLFLCGSERVKAHVQVARHSLNVAGEGSGNLTEAAPVVWLYGPALHHQIVAALENEMKSTRSTSLELLNWVH